MPVCCACPNPAVAGPSLLRATKCSCIPLFRPTAPRTGLSLATFFNSLLRSTSEMNDSDFLAHPRLDLTVRVGCALTYEASVPIPILLVLKPSLDLRQLILEEKLIFGPALPTEQLADTHGNVVYRMMLMPGATRFCTTRFSRCRACP